jgi:zinc protease
MKIDRSKKPSISSKLIFKMPSYDKFVLQNNLDVYFIKKDALPIIKINIVIYAGSKFEQTGKKGISNLLAMCIDEGAGEFDSLQLSEQFDLLGVQFSVNGNNDTIQLTLQTLKENFGKALELIGKILISPHFNEKDFKREKRKILTSLKQLKDDPDYLASTSFKSLLLGKRNPYSFPFLGLDKDINSITNEEVGSYYRNYIFPNNSFIVIVGDISNKELNGALDKYISCWKTGNFDVQFKSSDKSDEKVVYIVDKKDSVQTEIRTGHHTAKRNSKDYFPKHLLNTILGGQFSSRINLNLREKRGYTYGAGSSYNYYKDSAYFSVSTSVGIENSANALNEIIKELNKIRDGVTVEELKFAKSSIVRKFPLNFETNSQVASNFIGKVIYDLPNDHFDSYINNINSVSIEDVNKAAQDSIFPELATTVLVGDKEKLIPQLKGKDFGKVEVVNIF